MYMTYPPQCQQYVGILPFSLIRHLNTCRQFCLNEGNSLSLMKLLKLNVDFVFFMCEENPSLLQNKTGVLWAELCPPP